MPGCLSRLFKPFSHQSSEDRSSSACAPHRQTELAVNHSKLNEFNPTCLPVEVVTHIFCILKPPSDLYDPRTAIQSQIKHPWDIRATSQSPRCSAMNGQGKCWLDPREPLTLDIRGYTKFSRYAIHLAMTPFHPIRLTVKHLVHTRILRKLQDLLRCAFGPAPLLVSITAIPTSSYEPNSTITYDTVAEFKTPALRKLILDDWSVAIWPTLRVFINVHQRLSSLRTLALELIGLYTMPMLLPIINLPRLSSIKLRGLGRDCSVMLQHIRIPCIKALALTCDSEKNVNLPDLLAAVSALLAQNATEVKAQLQKPHRRRSLSAFNRLRYLHTAT
ncbi:hypothetical protein DFJ58DRAFT_888799 [Suillus subalutaceus]|uniref:uncharacterized protein n=1 Tax=Suillus subalutaceus TaxID=48586 RepID=UPI001B865F7B|nr:uncharacterized protein DFJ58DRAFT_888799 [Suillus subalutaceus]KAG1849680.1 hypothetical protein DFJ58DRAFT_888799 [Suillus subalutaceus]